MRPLLQPKRDSIIQNMLPITQFQLYSDIGGFHLNPERKAALLTLAKKLSEEEYDILPASIYMQFKQNGNRSVFQNLYFKRRKILSQLLLAEVVCEDRRYLSKIIDGIWLLLEETSWVVPAHNPSKSDMDCPLPYAYGEKVDYIDLFSAETGSLLAFAYFLIKDELDSVTPLVSDRILYELNRRIIIPFAEHDDWWWMGFSGRKINNWAPWIVSNILTICALCTEDFDLRCQIVSKAIQILDHFTNGYDEAGGCDEGPGYWNEAGASYFDCLEILYDMTGGNVSLFEDPFIKNMGEYIAKVNICGNYYINFADCDVKNHFSYIAIQRFGRRVHSDFLESFAIDHCEKEESVEIQYNCYRSIKNLCEISTPKSHKFSYPAKIWVDGVEIMALRETNDPQKGLFLAMKGGHNAESHNHNDIGNFIVYNDGKPLIIDVGVGTYTANTFNENRYTIWTMQSAYHNLPSINGNMQCAGKEYTSQNAQYEESDGRLTMELSNAYPKESSIKSYKRSGEMKNGEIIITDSVLFHQPSNIEFHLMLADRPYLEKPGVLQLAGQRCCYFSSDLKINIETIKIDDPQIAARWQRNELYRVCMNAEHILQNEFVFRVL